VNTINESLHAQLAPLASQVRKQQALCLVLIDLQDLQFTDQGEDAPIATFYGQPVTGATERDEMAIGDFYNERKWNRDDE
jgi:hypothetical protein